MPDHLSPHHPDKDESNGTKFKSEFVNWLNNNSSFFWTQLIAILGFIGVLLEIIVHTHDLYKEEGGEKISKLATGSIFFLQFAFILVVIFILNSKSFVETIHLTRYKIYYKRIFKKDLPDAQTATALKTNDLNIKIFGRYWLSFWKWIFLLYLVLFAKSLLDPYTPNAANAIYLNQNVIYIICSNVFATFLNNFSMANLFVCFLIVQSPLSSLSYDLKSINTQLNKFFANKDHTFFIINGFSIIHLFVFLSVLKLDGSSFSLMQNDTDTINTIFNSLSGLFNCIALALLIARLDSKIVNVPSNLISILMVYAALQPLYIFFANEKNYLIILIVSGFTLMFKVYFYLIVAYIINTGRIADLFMTFPLIKRMIEKDGYGYNEMDENGVDPNVKNLDEFNKHLHLMSLILDASGFRSKKYNNKLSGIRREMQFNDTE